MLARILILTLALAALLPPLAAEEKSAPVAGVAAAKGAGPGGAELTAAESRQLDRITDLYAEVAQQIAETQARWKVLSEMQQKLASDFQAFQAAVVAARGHKPGQATLDVQLRKVVPVPPKPDAGSR